MTAVIMIVQEVGGDGQFKPRMYEHVIFAKQLVAHTWVTALQEQFWINLEATFPCCDQLQYPKPSASHELAQF